MKEETRIAKLNALLGITEKVEEIIVKSTGKIVGISEEEIAEFREIQGVMYFLQAPKLFTQNTCKTCGEIFVVSRRNVAYCSYLCLKQKLNEQGFEWRKGKDLEAVVVESWEGNEPLWVKAHTLKRLRTILENLEENLPESPSPTPPSSNPEPSGSLETTSMETTVLQSSSTNGPILPSSASVPGKSSSRRKGSKPKRSFVT